MTYQTQSKAGPCSHRSIRKRLRFALRRRSDSIIDWALPSDELTRLANKYGSDKGNRVFGRHYYTRIYQKFLSSLRHAPIKLLELRLRHPMEESYSAVA